MDDKKKCVIRPLSEKTDTCNDPVTDTARKVFDVPYLYPWQRIVIANILDAANMQQSAQVYAENEDGIYAGRQIVLLPTGSGKSMCFLVPALLLKGPTLILYPLLALMSDQQRRINAAGIPNVIFRGQQTDRERDNNFKKIKDGAKIILANPEVLQNEKLLSRLAKCGITHIAIDEAHCVAEWGDSFRPAYLTVGSIIQKLCVSVVTAFTATASPSVLSRIAEILFHGEAHIVESDGDRPEISYHVLYAYAKKRAAFKLALTEQRPLLVFCGTRKKAEETAREIAAYPGQKDLVKFYHAGLKKEEKKAVEEWFFSGKKIVLCATCAYGMGIDKKDIRTVIHLDPPVSMENYAQETGRAARDKQPAKAILLWSYTDSSNHLNSKPGSREYMIKKFAGGSECRRQVLLEALGFPDAATAVCSGCDICDRQSSGHIVPIQEAQDALLAIDYITRHRKCLTKPELEYMLQDVLNSRDRGTYRINIWEHADVTEILFQLEKEQRIRICNFPWKNRIDIKK